MPAWPGSRTLRACLHALHARLAEALLAVAHSVDEDGHSLGDNYVGKVRDRAREDRLAQLHGGCVAEAEGRHLDAPLPGEGTDRR